MIDTLGLEERVITMYEMENVDSNIVRLQRCQKENRQYKSAAIQTSGFKSGNDFARRICRTRDLNDHGVGKYNSKRIVAERRNHKPKDPGEKPEDALDYVEVNYIAGDGGDPSRPTTRSRFTADSRTKSTFSITATTRTPSTTLPCNTCATR